MSFRYYEQKNSEEGNLLQFGNISIKCLSKKERYEGLYVRKLEVSFKEKILIVKHV